jgi:hypothetical protein
MKRVKWVEDLNIRIIGTQGILGVGVSGKYSATTLDMPTVRGADGNCREIHGRR